MLEVRDLTVSIGKKRVIEGASFTLEAGRVMSLVGESGSGKTMTAFALLDLLPHLAVRERGEVIFKDKNIFTLDPEKLRQIRGSEIAMVFQEPFTALNPVMRSRDQISETISAHGKVSTSAVEKRVDELLSMVKLPKDSGMRYPHELSGGMRQRVVLAMALACDPEVLILDEPTTALDVSIQKEILDLIKRIQDEKHFAILFITHDFSVVNVIADEVCVMKEGVIVEKGPKQRVLNDPEHEYTKQLIDCIPRLGDKRRRLPA